VLWFLNPEAASVLYVSAGGFHPVPVALVAAAGQAVAHGLLWTGGAWLRRNWPFFDRQCNRVLARWGPRLAGSTIPVAAASGLLGLPPTAATAVLAPGLGLRPQVVLPLLLVGRIIRFTVIGLTAAGLLGR